MCVTVCLFHAPLGCGIHAKPPHLHLPLMSRRWRHNNWTAGTQTKRRRTLTDAYLSKDAFMLRILECHFTCVCVCVCWGVGDTGNIEYVWPLPGPLGHTMLLSVWTWQPTDVMAGRTTALATWRGVTWLGQRGVSRALFCWFRLWRGNVPSWWLRKHKLSVTWLDSGNPVAAEPEALGPLTPARKSKSLSSSVNEHTHTGDLGIYQDIMNKWRGETIGRSRSAPDEMNAWLWNEAYLATTGRAALHLCLKSHNA